MPISDAITDVITDAITDVIGTGGEPPINFVTFDPDNRSPIMIFSEGDLRCTSNSDPLRGQAFATGGVRTGKWYWEAYSLQAASAQGVGIGQAGSNLDSYLGSTANDWGYFPSGAYWTNNVNQGTALPYTFGDILGFALDMAGNFTVYVNGVESFSVVHGLTGETFAGVCDAATGSVNDIRMNFGSDSSFGGRTTKQNNPDSSGAGDFYYAPPAGYLALRGYENFALNSGFGGAAGSVGTGNWTPPLGWENQFWNPTDAIALGDGQIRFVAENTRGYLGQNFDTSSIVGQTVNVSVFVDQVSVTSVQRPIHLTGDATLVDNNNNNLLSVGRKSATYVITGNSVSIRVGAGTTANATSDFICSRPQLTIGEELRPYFETPVPDPAPTFEDTFTDAEGTLLSAHTPDLGANWTLQGSDLGVTDNNSVNARGTGSGANSPNFWGNLMPVPAPVGRKLIRFTSSGGYGGTSLAQGVFVKSSVDGNNKIICGIWDNNLVFQVWQAGAFTNTIVGQIPDTATGTTPYPEEFFVIIDGVNVTCGYGDWLNPTLVGTYDTTALIGLGDGIGLIMRASGPDGIYDIDYSDI